MKIETKLLFEFISKKCIDVYPEQKAILNDWKEKTEKGIMKYIFFDSEDMWINGNPENIVGFWWNESGFNINDEVLKYEYDLTVDEIASLNVDIKSKLLEYMDYMDRMEISNQIFYNEVFSQKS